MTWLLISVLVVQLLTLVVIQKKGALIMSALDDLKAAIVTLTADVAAEKTAEDSAIALLTNLTQLLKDAIASSTVPQEQIDAVKAVNAQIEAQTATLAGAVAANTPTP